ncbi:hypothetical protein Ahy_B09g097827 isoform B [Arachis hypogaea]|uniref:Uncharacterized protein n=1 Tax=Arachis hypogaea TaxID=3818 RepID=A0A444XQ00_ARAHY|nr:hypothetical protein Ahy_B09g097827 isoform B [Arachis hypogaea]
MEAQIEVYQAQMRTAGIIPAGGSTAAGGTQTSLPSMTTVINPMIENNNARIEQVARRIDDIVGAINRTFAPPICGMNANNPPLILNWKDDPNAVTSNFAETEKITFSINMASIEPMGKDNQFELDMFKAESPIYSKAREDLLDFFLGQREEEGNVDICPRCSTLLDTLTVKAFNSYKKSRERVYQEKLRQAQLK